MKPVSPVIPGAGLKEVFFAKNQPPYLPLPAVQNTDTTGTVTTRWHLTWKERAKIFFSGNLWLQILTFHKPPQPVKLTTDCPLVRLD